MDQLSKKHQKGTENYHFVRSNSLSLDLCKAKVKAKYSKAAHHRKTKVKKG